MPRSLILLFAFVLPCAAYCQQVKGTRPAITGISHMTLYADDLAKSQQFYHSLLGWEQVPAESTQSGVRFYANHLQYIELLSPPSKNLVNRLYNIGFSTSDAESLRQFLAANGVTIPDAITVKPDGIRFFQVDDPEGNRIQFIQEDGHGPKAPLAASTQLSSHIIHVGFVIRDRAKADHFYQDILGFHLYWQGGMNASHIDWVMMQVPNGTDWLEYMLYLPAAPSREQLGSANHFAPGVVSIAELEKQLRLKGWAPSAQGPSPLLGVDGKWQLSLRDPDGTRAEIMEFQPAKEPCCTPYSGPQPGPSTNW